MNISLTSKLDKWVHKKVESGLYNSASEVVRESLRLLMEKEENRQLLLSELRSELRLGVHQLDAGISEEFTAKTVDRIKSDGRRKLSES